MDNFYLNQGNAIKDKLTQGINILNEQITIYIDDIKAELIKTNDVTAETHIQSCENMSNKIQKELIVKIQAEIDYVKAEAQKWQGWYNDMKSIMGNHGYAWAEANGFPAWKETIVESVGRSLTAAMNSSPAANIITKAVAPIGGAIADAYLGPNATRTRTIYHWTAYNDLSIDSNGYMPFTVDSYKSEDGNVEETASTSAIIASEADYINYYVNRGGGGTGGGSSHSF